ncbi:MAG: hypothetical protein Q7R44_00110, partial [bacterium]|nr:hypothetical protein [bacterium]
YLRLIAQNALNCGVAFNIPRLTHELPYLISIEHKNKSGRGLLFWLENETTDKSDMDTYLPVSSDWTTSYIVVPPQTKDGAGYSLHFDNTSIGNVETVNDIARVSINPIPYDFLTGLNITYFNLSETNQQETIRTDYERINSALYQVSRQNSKSNNTLVLSQSFHQGWKAYYSNNELWPFFDTEIKNHVLVNNWANGWILGEQGNRGNQVVIVFWPQYLEYLGFILAGTWLLGLLVWRVKQ